MRTFLDANILISYLLNPEGENPINAVVEAAFIGEFTLLAADPPYEELIGKVGTKPWLARRITSSDAARLVDTLRAIAEMVPTIVEAIPPVTRDPKDDYLLAYALVGRADYLVTGDEDLVTAYELATPYEMTVTGLVRYFRKRREGQ